jgi:GT2 family glycosyltransferase
MNKKNLIEYFKRNGRVKILNPNHKFYGLDRKAEKIQTNSLKFEGGSWLYFKDLIAKNIFSQGFKIDDLMGGFIEYSYSDMALIKEIEGLK